MPKKEKQAKKRKRMKAWPVYWQMKYCLSLYKDESSLKRYFTTEALLIILVGKTQQTGTELRHLLMSREDNSDLKYVILVKLFWENYWCSSERFIQ